MYKQLSYSECFSDKIENGEELLVGMGTYMIADYENFWELFEKIGTNAEVLVKNPAIKEWYSKMKLDFDFSVFCHMMAFNNVIRQQYPDIIDRKKRSGNRLQEAKKLSEAVLRKKCACAEFAILAQAYFQKQNIPTRFVCGELVVNNEFDDFEAHSFIVLSNNGKEYIFDPVNPYVYNSGKSILPHISEVIGKKDLCHVKTESLFKKGENWRYSCGEHGDFLHDLPKPTKNLKDVFSKSVKEEQNMSQNNHSKKKLSATQHSTLKAHLPQYE